MPKNIQKLLVAESVDWPVWRRNAKQWDTGDAWARWDPVYTYLGGIRDVKNK